VSGVATPGAETLAGLLAGGDDSALVLADGSGELGYDRLGEIVAGLAGGLAGAGAERGDRVAIVLPPGPVLVEALFAVTALGAAAAPLNPSYTTPEFAYYLKDLDPRIALVPPGEGAAARAAAAPLGIRVLEAAGDGLGDIRLLEAGKAVGGSVSFGAATPEDVALLLHTSGTTSKPKQVPLLHRNVMASVRAIAGHYRLGPNDVSFAAMPLFHVHGMIASVWAALAGGGSVVLPSRLSARIFWSAIADGVTWFSASPTIHQLMLDHEPAGGPARCEAIRFVRSCSAALPPALHRRIEERFGVPVLEAYGMTEASHQITSNPLENGRVVVGSVGVPTGTDVRVVSPDGVTLPPGHTGEVVIRGPGVMRGYLNADEANAAAFISGWFRTGDLGVVAEDGYVTLGGRIKELIIRGGENISPLEVEEALTAHPSVREAVCFGIPDEKYGETVAAAVAATAPVTSRELRAFCAERLASFKVPTVVHVLDELPRTPTGKVQRRRMPALLAAEAGD
jgi:acyl-CoA synthetase (AMP-forming)/AMP-acid ligase II